MLTTYIPRVAMTWIRGMGHKRVALLAEVRLPMRAWPFDLDVYLHLNNGRYLTLMDFGRFQHAQRTGLMQTMVRKGWKPLLGGAQIEFLREIGPLQRFDLVTRLCGWDQKWFYMEQRFECAGVVHARSLIRGVMKEGRRTVPPSELMVALGVELAPPEPWPELARFMASGGR